ncbi:hypothetical protein MVEG_00469 [Podila verticillata NRRL 6337]|nr:hypothetical protein MVEG_00469 [Podila verticillata NRRL 6337]
MDADHSRPSTLPTKLRWRPYSNGTSIKSKRAKKETQLQQQQLEKERSITREKNSQDINPKALAYKVRGGKPHYVGKVNPSNEVQLQWEEAETIESMSAGGHPHNQHNHHPVQPANSHQPNTIQAKKEPQGHGSSTLPSPPMARLALVGGESDLGHYKASLPVLTGESLGQGSMSLSSILGNSSKNHSYHLALTALLENHRSQMRLSQMTTPSATPSISSMTDSASQPSPTNTNRKMSSSELLSISTIDELLESCGYVDDTLAPTSFLASPATTNQSFHSSPDTTLLDRSPGALFGSPSLLSTTRNQMSPVFAQNGLVQDLSSPFAYLSSNRDPLLNNAPSAWPSLFPVEGSDRDSTQHVEMATQEQSKQYLTPSSGISTYSSPLSNQGQDSDVDTEWFGYMDESSPLFDDGSLPMPVFAQDVPLGTIPGTTTSSTKDDEEPNKTIWNWAEEMLRPAAMAPTGHRGFPSTGPMARTSQFGGGGLVRTLQSNYQQKSGYHTKAAPRIPGSATSATAPTSTTSAASIVAAAVRGRPVGKTKTKTLSKEDVPKKEEAKVEKQEASSKQVSKELDPSKGRMANGLASRKEAKDVEGYRGLLAMFRGLWQGNEGGKGDKP